jgi:hypothetical protein
MFRHRCFNPRAARQLVEHALAVSAAFAGAEPRALV